ncbi:MAG: hypothetical protein ACK2T4_10765 [Candidatus Promineifilaceae bacterium]
MSVPSQPKLAGVSGLGVGVGIGVFVGVGVIVAAAVGGSGVLVDVSVGSIVAVTVVVAAAAWDSSVVADSLPSAASSFSSSLLDSRGCSIFSRFEVHAALSNKAMSTIKEKNRCFNIVNSLLYF